MHKYVSETIIHISCAKFKSFTGDIIENLSNRFAGKPFLYMANISLHSSVERDNINDTDQK